MRKKRLKGAANVIDLVEHNPARGGLFWFLHQEHDTIIQRMRGSRMPWQALLAEVQALSLMNADGLPVANVESLRKTWSRARVLKKREAAAKQSKAETRKPAVTNSPPPVVARTLTPVQAQASVSSSIQLQLKPRAAVEEEARLAAQRRPDLFPDGPDVVRYKLYKGRRDV